MAAIFRFDAFSPREIAERVSELGVAKTRLPLASLVMLGMLAGGSVLVALVYHVIYVRPRTRKESP